MESINLILLYCGVRTGNFGVGSHVGSLLPYIKREKRIRLLIIHTDDQEAETVGIEKMNGVDTLHIPQPENKLFLTCSPDSVQKTYAKRLVELIYPYIKDLKNPIFWVNSIDYLNVCTELKYSLDRNICLLYVHHSWSWKYRNNVEDSVFAEAFYKADNRVFAKAIDYTRHQQSLAMLADRVVTVTHQAEDFFVRYLGLMPDKITTIYNGIDFRKDSFPEGKGAIRMRLGIRANEKIVLFTGRIKADKGLGYLIRGFKKVLEAVPDCRLVIVGLGDFGEFIPMTYPYSSRVTFTGKLAKQELFNWYRIADVGILPSLHEQCSYTAIEMRFFEVPLIVSSVDGLDEQFRDEYDALKLGIRLTETGEKSLEPGEIASCILRLLSDPVLVDQLVQNSFREAKSKFTAKKMWSQYLDLIQKMQGELQVSEAALAECPLKVSVIMPCYNAEKYLREAIDSILCQTLPDFELIVVDDGSTDGTERLVAEFRDERVRYVRIDGNQGNYTARNKGMQLARGKFIAMADADDISLPDRLQIQFDYLGQHSEIAAIGGLCQTINDRGQVIGKIERPLNYGEIKIAFLVDNYISQPTLMFRKELIDQGYRYDESFLYSGDYDFVFRIAHDFPVANLDQVLVKYRAHPEQISASKREMQFQYANQVRLRQLIDFGVAFTKEEQDIHLKLVLGKPLDKTELVDAEVWLNKLIDHNKKVGYYHQGYFHTFCIQVGQSAARRSL